MNALKELTDVLDGDLYKIKCATINHSAGYDEDDLPIYMELPIGYSAEAMENFKKSLDFNYDAGYGGQELFGTIWLKEEGVWLTRGEYDGSEWWRINRMPEIPKELQQHLLIR